ncbi:hypothetical protein ACEPAI_1379 [Sanghuangporus weigelae]
MKRSEGFTEPSDQQRAKSAKRDDSYHGSSGPVQVTSPNSMYDGPHQPTFVTAIQNVTDIDLCQDINDGNANCVSYMPNSINWHQNVSRSSSASVYSTPVEERTNWITLVGHQVMRILVNGTSPEVTAIDVQFRTSDDSGDIHTANVCKEVILAAGTVGTPQLCNYQNQPPDGGPEPTGANNSIDRSAQSTFNKDDHGPSAVIAFPSLKELFPENGGSNGGDIAE